MSKTVKNYAISFLKSTLFGLDKDVSVYGNTLQINEVVVSTNVEARGNICDAEAVEAWEWVNVEKWKLLSSKSKDDSDLKEAFDFLQEVMFDRLAQVQRDYDSILKGYRISAIETHVNNWTQDDDDFAREQEEYEFGARDEEGYLILSPEREAELEKDLLIGKKARDAKREYDKEMIKKYGLYTPENGVDGSMIKTEKDFRREIEQDFRRKIEQEERLKDTIEINNSARDYQEVAKALVAGVYGGYISDTRLREIREELAEDTLDINNSARDYQEVAKALVAGVVIGETIPEELEDKLAEADSVFYETMKERKEYYQKIEVQYDTESEHDKEVSLKANPRRNFLHEVMARGKLEYNEVLVDDSQPIISVGKKASEVFGGYIADTRAEKTREDYEGYSL